MPIKFTFVKAKLDWVCPTGKTHIRVKIDDEEYPDAIKYEWHVQRIRVNHRTPFKYNYVVYGIIRGQSGNSVNACRYTAFLRNKYESRHFGIANLRRIIMPSEKLFNGEYVLTGHLDYRKVNLLYGNSQFPNKFRETLQDVIDQYERKFGVKPGVQASTSFPVANVPHIILGGNWALYVNRII